MYKKRRTEEAFTSDSMPHATDMAGQKHAKRTPRDTKQTRNLNQRYLFCSQHNPQTQTRKHDHSVRIFNSPTDSQTEEKSQPANQPTTHQLQHK